MGSERAQAKRDVVRDSAELNEPASLRDVLTTAQASQNELVRERNRNRETILQMELAARAREQEAELRERAQVRTSELGLIGHLLGGKENAPTSVALIALGSGILAFFLCLHYAAYSAAPETWHREAEGSLAFAASALAFIFGRSSKR